MRVIHRRSFNLIESNRKRFEEEHLLCIFIWYTYDASSMGFPTFRCTVSSWLPRLHLGNKEWLAQPPNPLGRDGSCKRMIDWVQQYTQLKQKQGKPFLCRQNERGQGEQGQGSWRGTPQHTLPWRHLQAIT